MSADWIWNRAREFTEVENNDPDDLWEWIVDHGRQTWNDKRTEYGLHRFPMAHERLWPIAERMVSEYAGDATNIWSDKRPAEVRSRLERLGAGPQISSMIVGALSDTEQIIGAGDVKADIHVRRVIGRVVEGDLVDEAKAIELTRLVHPDDPWMLDRPLFELGKQKCRPSNPLCSTCYLEDVCTYAGA